MASLTEEPPHVGVTAPHLLPPKTESVQEQLNSLLKTANKDSKEDANDYSRFDKLDDPDDESDLDQAKLAKEEGNRFFKMRNYYEAIQKYTDTVNLLKTKKGETKSPPTHPTQVDEEVQVRVAALSNRAACHLKLRNFKDCIQDCDTILKRDKQHTKALFRRSQAHKSKGMNEMAYRDVLLLLDVDGLNKPALKEKKKLEKELHSRSRDAIRSRIDKDKSEAAEKIRKTKETARKKVMKEEEKKRTEARLATMTATTTTTAANMAPPAKVIINTDDIIKDSSEESGELMRGYKKTKEGRTTSYFTRELDDKAKALLGDTAPKRLDGQDAARPVERKTSSTSSAWNSAGTYEERDRTQFCTDLLTRTIGASVGSKGTVVLDEEEYTVEVTGVKKVEGEGSMVSVRGSLRFLWDYSFVVHYKILLKTNSKSIKGSLSYQDFTQDIKETPDITHKCVGKGFKDDRDILLGGQALALLQTKMTGALETFGVACKDELRQ